MTIAVEQEAERSFDFDARALIEQVAAAALDAENCPYECEVDVLLTDSEAIREINREERNLDSVTDVLSFPMVDYAAPGDFDPLEEDDSLFHPDSGELLLGDMVINLDRVKSQAAEYGHSEKRELAFLVAHSMFHLMGYDHMEEAERLVMEKKQEDLLQTLGITRE